MVFDPEQFLFMLLGVDYSLQTNLVGVTLDNKLNFATHLLNITKIPTRSLMY